MPGINGVQTGSKAIEVQKSEELGTPVKTENSSPKEKSKDVFETSKEKTTLDSFASGPNAGSKLVPGEAMTAKGLAYLKWREARNPKQEPGEARTAKGEAYLKWKDTQSEKQGPGEARTAKGHAYEKMMKAEAQKSLKENAVQQSQPGEAPRVKKHSGRSN